MEEEVLGIPLDDLIAAYPDPAPPPPVIADPPGGDEPEAEPEPEPPDLDMGPRLTLVHGGLTYAHMTPARLLAVGVPQAAIEAALLDQAKAAARARLTEHITRARSALITVLPGQEMVYLAKEAEAEAWVAALDPDLADYPLLAAEVGVTAETADQLAQLWLNMGALWRGAAAQLEALRLTIAAAINAAETPEAVEAAVAAALA